MAYAKFEHPDLTASGEARALVPFEKLETLWFNTGTLCNIECRHCYIHSSPENDALSWLTLQDVLPFLDEIERNKLGTREIGFTGGEPFMNPHFPALLEAVLERGFAALTLTNAMQPLQRPKVQAALSALNERFAGQLVLRVSLDHYSPRRHDLERGTGSFKKTLAGLDWLADNGFTVQLAGRTLWEEDEQAERKGYARLIGKHGWNIDAHNRVQLVLFPEMDETADVPEITTRCWGLLGLEPKAMMCATSRMVIKRRGEPRPLVAPCTLIADDETFLMGETLQNATSSSGPMFRNGAIKLCHVHCAKFCVLGGGSCSR